MTKNILKGLWTISSDPCKVTCLILKDLDVSRYKIDDISFI